VPSLLDSRGALAGAGSAISLIAAALASLLFAAGLIGFTAWPAGNSPSVGSVMVPAAAVPAPAGAAGRATSVTLPAPVAAPLRATSRRAAARTVARPVSRRGSAPAAPSAAASSPTPAGSSPAPVGPPAPPSVTRQVTSGLADTTTAVTHQAGSAVGGPVGAAISSTGDTVAQTLDNVGSATQPLLGALGG
jgi:hypothetical protein